MKNFFNWSSRMLAVKSHNAGNHLLIIMKTMIKKI